MGKERIIGRPQSNALPQSLAGSAQSHAFKQDNLHTSPPEVNAQDDLCSALLLLQASCPQKRTPVAPVGIPSLTQEPTTVRAPSSARGSHLDTKPQAGKTGSSCLQAPSRLQDLTGEGVAAIQTIPSMLLMKLL